MKSIFKDRFSKKVTMKPKAAKLLDTALMLKNRAKSMPCPACIDYGAKSNCKVCKGMQTVWVLSHKDFSNLGVRIVEALHVNE